ncbi:MAG: hypothetical protein L0H37_06075 [Nitrosospira sp.]|nr:hypothetical protein [Nitrosospira sp.]
MIDWYSRKVLAWRLSNTLDSGFCVETAPMARLPHTGCGPSDSGRWRSKHC